ncbi:MAG: helix-turn-helix domain-containing protein [Nocardioides sp.]|uniref:helix-turn-helix domain-containing protein n=1 Tax=Nocardioides sp. TaxID=35761 RepID=UPI0039E313FF
MDGLLGPRLRAAREARGWTLRSVAATVGISPSLLSQVETGKIHPSVSTLYALVSHLGVSIDELLGHAVTGSVTGPGVGVRAVLRAEDTPRIAMENGVTWDRLAVDGRGLVDPLLTTYAPGGSSSVDGRSMRHPGIEYGYLISGELTLRLEDEATVLKAGDSMCFDSQRPHLYVNHTDEETRGIWFVVGGPSEPDGQPIS